MQKVKVPLVLFLFLFSACTVPMILQTDPVGAGLLTMKTFHASAINSSADAYLEGRITQAQMVKIRDAGRIFDKLYAVALSIHATNKLGTSDPQYKDVEAALRVLQTLVNDLVLKAQTTPQKG